MQCAAYFIYKGGGGGHFCNGWLGEVQQHCVNHSPQDIGASGVKGANGGLGGAAAEKRKKKKQQGRDLR